MTFTQHYVHCPNCNDFDRHFDTEGRMKGQWFCQHCMREFPKTEFIKPEVSDKWIPQVKGDEISVIQMKDLHGRLSFGWFSDTKVLIAKAGSTEPSPIFDALVALATEEANRRNAAQ